VVFSKEHQCVFIRTLQLVGNSDTCVPHCDVTQRVRQAAPIGLE
jgi:hypothetical protein